MNYSTDQNKAIVVRFNKECVEQGNLTSFHELLADDVINHSSPEAMPNGKESFIYFLNGVLRTGFPDIKVEILDQAAERDLVTTRKRIVATHTGEMLGIAPTNKKVEIKVIDIIRLRNGQYIEHWGESNLPDVIAQISSK